jgi:hypothetical protein
MENFLTFKNGLLGRRVDYDHVYACQCVDLILQGLHDMHNCPTGVRGNAIDYCNRPSQALVNIAAKLPPGTQPAEGDIAVLKTAGYTGDPAHDPGYGHIGWATGNYDANNLEILEQNGATGGGTGLGGDAIRTRWVPRSRIACLWRFHDQPSPTPTPASVPATTASGLHVGEVLHLPGSVATWRVYPENGPWTPGHEIAKVCPAEFGGLDYLIQRHIAGDIYAIQTHMFGRVAIYAGADTPATFVPNKQAPAPAPVVPVVPAPTPAKPSNIEYSRLASPLQLIVNKNTHKWGLGFADDAHATSVEDVPQGTPFRAFGRAQRTDGDRPAYFMAEEDFGNADQNGSPNKNVGINTVDLSPTPTINVSATATVASDTGIAAGYPAIPPAPAGGQAADNVQVTVKAADWRNSYTAFLTPQKYRAIANITVDEIDETIPVAGDHPLKQQLIEGQPVTVAGTFWRDSVKYYRTKISVQNGFYYGIPLAALKKMNADEELDHLAKSALDEAAAFRSMTTSTVDGFVKKIMRKKK